MRSEELHSLALRENWLRDVCAARVRIGALYCDNNERADWPIMVDSAELNMGNSECCVIGQLYGDWEIGPFMGNTEPHRDMGFDLWTATDWDRALETIGNPDFYYSRPDQSEEYALLGWAWRREIMARRDAARSTV
jgi:hypothetical protein